MLPFGPFQTVLNRLNARSMGRSCTVETPEEYGSLWRLELTVINIDLVASPKARARQNFADVDGHQNSGGAVAESSSPALATRGCRAARDAIFEQRSARRDGGGTMKSDSDIKRDVEEELRFDPDLDA